MDTIIDNIGVPNSWTSLAQGDIPTISSADGEILISLNKEKHGSTRDYEVLLRKRLNEKFPDTTFFFQPANITNQILNFGLPAPIDLQVVGRDAAAGYKIAQRLAARIARIPGAADVHVHQVVDQPEIRLNVDRVKAAQMGLTERDVTGNMLISLSGSSTVAPNFWVNWANGVNYNVAVQTPAIQSRTAWTRCCARRSRRATSPSIPPPRIARRVGHGGEQLGGRVSQRRVASLRKPRSHRRQHAASLESGYLHPRRRPGDRQSLQCVAGVRRVRQRGPARSGRRRLAKSKKSWMRNAPICRAALRSICAASTRRCNRPSSAWAWEWSFAVVLVYLLMSVNFQSWLDPFIILTALPGAMAGILWMLFVTGTTLNVPSLMGAIMCIGVATANSILMVTFANDERALVPSAREAMLSAGYARIRPVLMTAIAMMLGMLPMALGLGEGGEQNAPLGRAVIGGLLFATVTTLFVVPIIYSYLRTKPPVDHERQLEEEERNDSIDSEWNSTKPYLSI